MNIITLDFETLFNDEYTLKKMTTEAYIRDPRFEVHGCGIQGFGHPTEWIEAKDVRAALLDFNVAQNALLCHHGQFEGLILSHHFGIVPAMYIDTMAMGRLLFGQDVTVSLESLAKIFGLDPKSVPYEEFRGKHWWEMAPDLQQRLANGCCHDVDLTWQVFCLMMQGGDTDGY